MEIVEQIISDADEAGFRLEYIAGLGVWEVELSEEHQRNVERIRQSIRLTSDFVHAADILVRFSGGSFLRPDISIFSHMPDEELSAVTLMPEAVIEILSRGYEAKDLEIGIPFYRRMGVKDVVVLDPDTNAVTHYQNGNDARNLTSPVEVIFACGCRCTV